VGLNGNQVSWQGMNDLSARPAPRGLPFQNNSVILNTLGDLTNRENRFAYTRFTDDLVDTAGNLAPDGLPDDVNGDNVPDYYPTLYPGVLPPADNGTGPPINGGNQLIFEPLYPNVVRQAAGIPNFPHVFPGAYSTAQVLSTDAYGWIHSPNPQVNVGTPLAPVAVPFEGNAPWTTLDYLHGINHSPLDTGDNLIVPPSNVAGYNQTWWGFPTWRETLSPLWTDPTTQVNVSGQPLGLAPLTPVELSNGAVDNGGNTRLLLPPLTALWRPAGQPYTDSFGAHNLYDPTASVTGPPLPNLWTSAWEDDLILTGVRSFDVKAYDNTLAGYADLGWGDDLRNYPLNVSQNPNNTAVLPFLSGTPNPVLIGNAGFTGTTPYLLWNNNWYDLINQTFAHEGRMPPLVSDNRYDAQFGAVTAGYYSAYPNYNGNIGDNTGGGNGTGIVRLRRVWDSWSTDYTRAPGVGVNPLAAPNPFFPAGPPYSPPVYPSYPPPYPAPLRGIQIQVRVVDPSNQRIKVLTIRQDFTDKI
jgi:hypothetical protein